MLKCDISVCTHMCKACTRDDGDASVSMVTIDVELPAGWLFALRIPSYIAREWGKSWWGVCRRRIKSLKGSSLITNHRVLIQRRCTCLLTLLHLIEILWRYDALSSHRLSIALPSSDSFVVLQENHKAQNLSLMGKSHMLITKQEMKIPGKIQILLKKNNIYFSFNH